MTLHVLLFSLVRTVSRMNVFGEESRYFKIELPEISLLVAKWSNSLKLRIFEAHRSIQF